MIIENNILKTITASFDRSPNQRNKLLESDAEIISLKNGTYLAATVDNIVEEIATGLYSDPYLIGWMAVMSSISDLSAVGASPLGLLLTENIPSEYPADKLALIQKGIHDACSISGTYVIGGDTNNSGELQLGATAIGIIENEPKLNIMNKLSKRLSDIISENVFTSGSWCKSLNSLYDSYFSPSWAITPGAYAGAGIFHSSGIGLYTGLLEELPLGTRIRPPPPPPQPPPAAARSDWGVNNGAGPERVCC